MPLDKKNVWRSWESAEGGQKLTDFGNGEYEIALDVERQSGVWTLNESEFQALTQLFLAALEDIS